MNPYLFLVFFLGYLGVCLAGAFYFGPEGFQLIDEKRRVKGYSYLILGAVFALGFAGYGAFLTWADPWLRLLTEWGNK